LTYLYAGKNVADLLKDAGLAVADNIEDAGAVVVEVPLYIEKAGELDGVPAIAAITGPLDFASVRSLSQKGIGVAGLDVLAEKVRELIAAGLRQKADENAEDDEMIIFDDPSASPCDADRAQSAPAPVSEWPARPAPVLPEGREGMGNGDDRDWNADPDRPVDVLPAQPREASYQEVPDNSGFSPHIVPPAGLPPSRSFFSAGSGVASRSEPGAGTEAPPGGRPPFNLPYSLARRGGTIVASFSTKGGAGKTALASNLAAAAAVKGLRTVLVDLDIGTGNAAEVLHMEDALKGPNVNTWREHARNITGALKRHSSGLYLLPTGDEALTGEDVEDLSEILVSNFDLTVFDFGTKPFHPYTRTGLELASKVFVLALQEQGMVEVLVSRFLAEHPDWISSGKAALVVNRSSPLGYYKPAQVAKMAGFRSYKEIPDDPGAFEAAKRTGKTVVQLKGSAARDSILLIAGEIIGSVEAGEVPAAAQKLGFFSRFFKRRRWS
jgi:MinD-like ATPase involved in chromosome partitioning or flagellar assembly